MLLWIRSNHTKHRQRSKDPKNIAAALFLNRNWLHRSPRSSGDHSSLQAGLQIQNHIQLRSLSEIQQGHPDPRLRRVHKAQTSGEAAQRSAQFCWLLHKAHPRQPNNHVSALLRRHRPYAMARRPALSVCEDRLLYRLDPIDNRLGPQRY